MNEDFLSYAWKFGLFQHGDLSTREGEPLQIVHPGTQNFDAGPDFFQAKIRIGDTLWVGNVELHVLASDWKRHKHQFDKAYNNVILHVVYKDDCSITNQAGEAVQALALEKRIDKQLFHRYLQFLKNKSWVPCENRLSEVSSLSMRSWLDRLMVQRLERKSEAIHQLLERTNNDWAETFYIILCRNFGFKVNADPMERLARKLSLATLGKHKDNLMQLESLLFGQAGLLPENPQESYPQELVKEFKYLKAKFNIDPLSRESWKFMRMRPTNFPTIRLSQLAVLIHQSQGLFARVLETISLEGFRELFRVVSSEYWLTHYHFEKSAAKRRKQLGDRSIDQLLVNSVVPFLFVYGRVKGFPVFEERALNLLEKLDPEPIGAMKRWSEIGVKVESALDTQALLELKSNYCNEKKCLICSIGSQLLKSRT